MLLQGPTKPVAHLDRLLSDPACWPGRQEPRGSRPQTGRSERRKVAFLAEDVEPAPNGPAAEHTAAAASVTNTKFISEPESYPQTPCLSSDDEEEDSSEVLHAHTLLPSPHPGGVEPAPRDTDTDPQPQQQDSRARWRRRAPGALVLVKRRWLQDLLGKVPSPHPQLEEAVAGAAGAEEDGEVLVQQQCLDQALGALPGQTATRYRMMREVLDTTAGFACMVEAAMDVDGEYTAHQVGSMLERFQAEQEGSFRERPASHHARREAAGRRHLINHVLGVEDLNAAAAVIQRAYRKFKEQRVLWKVATMKRGHVVERDWKLGNARSRPVRLKQEGQYAISPILKTESRRGLEDDDVQSFDGRQRSRFQLMSAHGSLLHAAPSLPWTAGTSGPSAAAAAMLACRLAQSSEPNLPTYYNTSSSAAAAAAACIASHPRHQLHPQLHTQLHTQLHPGFQARRHTNRYLHIQSSFQPAAHQRDTPGRGPALHPAPAIRRATSSLAPSSLRPSTTAAQTWPAAPLSSSSSCLPAFVSQGSTAGRPSQDAGGGGGGRGGSDQGCGGALLPSPSGNTRGGGGGQPWFTDSVPLAAMERSAGPAGQLQYLWRQSSLGMVLNPLLSGQQQQQQQPAMSSVPEVHVRRQSSLPKVRPQGAPGVREPPLPGSGSRPRRLTASDSGGGRSGHRR